MENRSLSVVAGLILGLLALPAMADEADWEARLKRAADMQSAADAKQKAAEAAFAGQNIACQEKFLVNACVDKARQAHFAETRESRRMQIEANTIEREVKREQAQAREARLAAEAAQRARDYPEREKSLAEERATADQQRQQKMDAKAAKAEAGARRKAAKAEEHQRKVAEHEAKVADRKARAEARAARDKP